MEKENTLKKIESLSSILPPEWKDKITVDFAKMKVESPLMINPEDEQKRFTITTIIQPDPAVRKKILDVIKPVVKDQKGLYLQPSDGFHFTIQWSDFLNGNLDKLKESLQELSLPPLELEIKLVYPSKPNLFAVLIPTNDTLWMSKIREKVTGLYNSSSFTPKLPEKLPLIWMSLVRFTNDFDPTNLNELVCSLPEKTIIANKFKLILTKADPFFTKKTATEYLSKDF